MSREGWYGGYNRGGPRGWGRFLLPLVIGVALGALLFGGLFGGAWRRSYDRLESRPSVPQLQQPPAAQQRPFQGEQRAAEQYSFERGHDYAYGPRGGWHRGGFPFGFGFPFGLGRLVLPLLLIAGGIWLFNRRRGPGAPPPPAQGGTPVGPAPADPLPPSDAPTTGPTTRL